MFIMFHADDINSMIIYKYIFRKVEGDSIDRPVCDTSTNFCASFIAYLTQILKVLQKLMPLLRFCMKANMCKNEYLEILKIILCFPLCAKNKR